MKTKKRVSNIDYYYINLIFLSVFILGLLYIIFFDNTLKCYYLTTFGYPCKTCGITRDFNSFLMLKFDKVINPISKYYFIAFSLIGLSRIVSLILTKFKYAKLNSVITFDVIIGSVSFGLLFYAINKT